MKSMLFISGSCPQCKALKQMFIGAGIEYKGEVEDLFEKAKTRPVEARFGPLPVTIFDTGTVDGLAESAFYEVKQVPTLIVLREDKESLRATEPRQILGILTRETA